MNISSFKIGQRVYSNSRIQWRVIEIIDGETVRCECGDTRRKFKVKNLSAE